MWSDSGEDREWNEKTPDESLMSVAMQNEQKTLNGSKWRTEE